MSNSIVVPITDISINNSVLINILASQHDDISSLNIKIPKDIQSLCPTIIEYGIDVITHELCDISIDVTTIELLDNIIYLLQFMRYNFVNEYLKKVSEYVRNILICKNYDNYHLYKIYSSSYANKIFHDVSSNIEVVVDIDELLKSYKIGDITYDIFKEIADDQCNDLHNDINQTFIDVTCTRFDKTQFGERSDFIEYIKKVK